MTRAAVLAAALLAAWAILRHRGRRAEPPPWVEEPDGVPAWDTYQAALLARR